MNKRWKRLLEHIVPSDKIIGVSVHKLKDKQKCDRYYFWRWIMNLEQKKINLNFYYGSIVHVGIEWLSKNKSFKFVEEKMRKEARVQRKRYMVKRLDIAEADLLLEIAVTTIKVYADLFEGEQGEWDIVKVETGFEICLKQSPLILTGTIDEYRQRGNKVIEGEYKTSSRVDALYFKKLKFDKQINTYAVGIKHLTGKFPSECIYFVFRKPNIRPRIGETHKAYIIRYEEDLYGRPDFYFFKHILRFGKSSMRGVFCDIEAVAFDLYSKYQFLGKEKVLIPENWPKSEGRCNEYGMCEFMPLCSNPNNWPLYAKLFQQRELRYDHENRELSTYVGEKKLKKKG